MLYVCRENKQTGGTSSFIEPEDMQVFVFYRMFYKEYIMKISVARPGKLSLRVNENSFVEYFILNMVFERLT